MFTLSEGRVFWALMGIGGRGSSAEVSDKLEEVAGAEWRCRKRTIRTHLTNLRAKDWVQATGRGPLSGFEPRLDSSEAAKLCVRHYRESLRMPTI